MLLREEIGEKSKMTAGVWAPLLLLSAIFISIRKVHPRKKVETELCTDEETL